MTKTLRGAVDRNIYAGILAEPMPNWTALTRPPDEEIGQLIEEKWRALFAHFGLDPTDAFEFGPKKASAWANLAWHLARQHVPGFKGAPRKRGRPAERKSDDVTLFMHVELLRRRDRLSDRKAIRKIAARQLIAGTEDALRKRYTNAKNQFRPISEMYDRMASAIGADQVVAALEEALSGDEKETIFSPN